METGDQVIRSLRVIYLGLITGIVAFVGVATIAKRNVASSQFATDIELFLGVLGLVALGCLAAYGVTERGAVARVAEARPRAERGVDDDVELLRAYRQVAVVRGGLAEAPSFLGGVIYVMTGSGLPLVAVALGVAVLVLRMPSRADLEAFAEKVRQHS